MVSTWSSKKAKIFFLEIKYRTSHFGDTVMQLVFGELSDYLTGYCIQKPFQERDGGTVKPQ